MQTIPQECRLLLQTIILSQILNLIGEMKFNSFLERFNKTLKELEMNYLKLSNI